MLNRILDLLQVVVGVSDLRELILKVHPGLLYHIALVISEQDRMVHSTQEHE